MNVTTTHGTQMVNRGALVRRLAQHFALVADGGETQSSVTSTCDGGVGEQSALNSSYVPPDYILADNPVERINLV